MRTASEEIGFRLNFAENSKRGELADSLSNTRKVSIYVSKGWKEFGIYVYKKALGIGERTNYSLYQAITVCETALQLCEEGNKLICFEAIFVAKSLLSEDLTGIAAQICEAANNNNNEYADPLYVILSCLRLGKDHTPYIDWLKKWETKKYTSVLPGTSEAIAYLINRDEERLVFTVDAMLLAHHKEANNRHSDIYNSPLSLLSLAPYLILEQAKFLGMDIQSKILNNKQTLKLGLMFPTESPDLPKNHKMPVEVDYLTAKTNLVNTL